MYDPPYVCAVPSGAPSILHPISAAVVNNFSVAEDGSFFALGTFRGDHVVFGAGEPRQTALCAWDDGMADLFVAKYTSSGALTWVGRAGGRRMDNPGGLVATRDGGAIVVGSYYDEMRFGPVDHSEATLPSSNSASFAARYDAEGHVAWARRIDGHYAEASKVAVTPEDAAIVVGHFEGELRFDDAPDATLHSQGRRSLAESMREVPVGTHSDGFAARYDRSGNLEWARAIGGPGSDVATAVAVDGEDAVVVGTFATAATLGGVSLRAVLLKDGFVARYAADGRLRWARSFGGAGADDAWAVTIDRARRTWVSATLGVIDPAAQDRARVLSPGRPERFLISYDTEGTRCSLEPLACAP